MMTTARQITNAWINRTLPDIFYEEPEGPAGAEDGMQQELPIDIIKGSLRERYAGRNDVFVSNLVFVSYDRSNGNARVQPDLFIAFDVDAAAIRENLPNFWIWETGKAPDFVMEVASPSTSNNDRGWKRDLYARLGVTEYWRFDPTGGDLYGQPLIGERLAGGEYVPCELDARPGSFSRAHSDLLDVDFYWDGAAGFDVLDPVTGKTIYPPVAEREARQESEAQRDEARSRAEQAEARAERSEARANEAETRAEQAETQRDEAQARAADAEAEAARLRERLRQLKDQ